MFLEEFLNDTSAQKKYFGQKVAYSACPFGLNDIIKDDIKDFNIVDVRNYEDYIDGHIPFAVHIPIDEFEEHLNMLEHDKINIIYCESDFCLRATKAAYKASSHGYKVKTLLGGYKIWKKLGFDTVKTSTEE